MKILLIANNLRGWKTWDKKIQELKDWWMPEINLDITLEHTDFKNIPWEEYTSTEGLKYKGIDRLWYDTNISLPSAKRGFDCVILTLAKSDWKGFPTEGSNDLNNYGIHEIQMLGQENARYMFNGVRYDGDQWFNIARHELSHAIYRSRGIVDNTHKYWAIGNLEEVKKELQGGFMGHPLITMFRNLLLPTQGYKYFNQNEIEGLKPELVRILDDMREYCGFAFVINSGKRTQAENDKLPLSSKNSGHLRGYEADIACTDSAKRDKILEASFKFGITRRGVGKTFVHLGVDPSLPQDVTWHYYK